MPAPLFVRADIQIPRHELRFSFVRSSGPGGQNVNKLNSKAVLRWSVRETGCLPADVQQRFCLMFARRINEQGELVLTSQRHREQGRNVADCLQKLRELVLLAATPPKPRKKAGIPRGARESRLRDKRFRAAQKQRRRPPSLDD